MQRALLFFAVAVAAQGCWRGQAEYRCAKDTDCRNGFSCQLHVCRRACAEPCPAGLECLDGACVGNVPTSSSAAATSVATSAGTTSLVASSSSATSGHATSLSTSTTSSGTSLSTSATSNATSASAGPSSAMSRPSSSASTPASSAAGSSSQPQSSSAAPPSSSTAACNDLTGRADCDIPACDQQNCDDNDLCTSWDRCVQGACKGTVTVMCDGVCNTGECNRVTGACAPKPDGTDCSGGNLCQPAQCNSGQCFGSGFVGCPPVQCNTSNGCNPLTGVCDYVPADDGVACQHPDLCVFSALCHSGACAASGTTGCSTLTCRLSNCTPQHTCEYSFAPGGTACTVQTPGGSHAGVCDAAGGCVTL